MQRDEQQKVKRQRSTGGDGGGTNNDDGITSKIGRGMIPKSEKEASEVSSNLSCMPDTLLIRVFQFLRNDDANRDLIAIERTCRVFRDLLGEDKAWAKIFPQFAGKNYENVPTARESVFLRKALRNIRQHQRST